MKRLLASATLLLLVGCLAHRDLLSLPQARTFSCRSSVREAAAAITQDWAAHQAKTRITEHGEAVRFALVDRANDRDGLAVRIWSEGGQTRIRYSAADPRFLGGWEEAPLRKLSSEGPR